MVGVAGAMPMPFDMGFLDDTYEIKTGDIVEFNYFDPTLFVHPVHIHINPFQLVSGTKNEDADATIGTQIDKNNTVYLTNYFKVGDFHDTLILPIMPSTMNLPPQIISNSEGFVDIDRKVRMHFAHYGGKLVQHCHILEHEDFGMMSIMNIAGDEGTYWRPEGSVCGPKPTKDCCFNGKEKPRFSYILTGKAVKFNEELKSNIFSKVLASSAGVPLLVALATFLLGGLLLTASKSALRRYRRINPNDGKPHYSATAQDDDLETLNPKLERL